MTFVIAYLITGVSFLALDALWLTTMVDRLYRPAIGSIMLEKPALGPAALFYVLYLFGVVWFAVMPALEARRPLAALGNGALLGIMAYGVYDLTNQATLKDWPWHLTLSDLAWGGFATACAATLGAWATPRVAGWFGLA